MKILVGDFLRQCELIQCGGLDHLNFGSLVLIESVVKRTARKLAAAKKLARARESKAGKGAKA